MAFCSIQALLEGFVKDGMGFFSMPSLFAILSRNRNCKDDRMPCAPNATDVGSQIICWLPMYLFVRGAGVLMGLRGTGTIPMGGGVRGSRKSRGHITRGFDST